MTSERRLSDQTMRTRWRSVAALATASVRADRARTILSVLLDITVSSAAPVMAVGTGLLVDAVLSDSPTSRVVMAVAVISAAGATLLTMGVVAGRVRRRLEENVAHHVELEVLGMVTGLTGVSHHENPAHLHRIDRLLEESWLIAMAVPASIATVEGLVRFLLTISILGTIDGRLLLLPLAILPTIWAGAVAERIRLAALDERAETGRRAEDIFTLVGRSENAGELRTFGTAGYLAARHEAAMNVIIRDERNHRLRGSWRLAVARLVIAVSFGLGLLAVAERASRGDVTPGALVMVLGLAGHVMGQAASISARLNWLNYALTGVRHYVWLLDYDAAHRSAPGAGEVPDRMVDGIRFEGVTFAYPDTDRCILEGLDLHIPAGAVVAVVGDNGAGKTTLVKLLLRMYEPTAGRILVDGRPLSELPVEAWRQRTTAALQDHSRPELVVREAIGIGDLGRLDDDVAVSAAAARSGADAVIATVPSGLDAQLGVEWPGGTELSGGQWQRLAVGRSAMREDPLVLLLDEPTAALDPHAEHALFEHYTGATHAERRARGAITIVISHRLSTVRTADRIVVLDGGRIAEEGTHEELMAAGGPYARLFTMQAASYGA